MSNFLTPDKINPLTSALQPGVEAEQANYTGSDYIFSTTPRYIKCSAIGILKVDFLNGSTEINLPVVPGVNPERITKIYSGSSDVMTVVGIV